ncbi:MAG: 1-deoxy-D-xylulose-5-phosphate reductoisomerase [Actinobacteria bacterium]|nr:MAG: 1-deoxy-D-xylulose-5-phosphate reductoisomerase [Actinomycetota bacterium]
MRPIVVLGATGSIGGQTLEVAARLGAEVAVLAAGTHSAALESLAARHPGAAIVISEPGDRIDEAVHTLGSRVSFGAHAVEAAAGTPGRIVVNGIVGAAGLAPSIAALEAGNRLALANKESLITAGPLVMAALSAGGGELIPVDSEHSAVWQCLAGEDRATLRRIVLTASGGPFRGRSAESLREVTVEEALAHPTWDMGPRITIDSATLMNKALEVIEAHHLFGLGFEDIDVVVHPQSYVHSFVEFVDGVVKAEVGQPDMRKPIQYAITYPERTPAPALPFVMRDLTFEAPDRAVFPCLDLGYEAGRRGGNAPAVLNAADEVAVDAFLRGAIGFTDIGTVVARALDAIPEAPLHDLGDVAEADRRGREAAREAAREAVRASGR